MKGNENADGKGSKNESFADVKGSENELVACEMDSKWLQLRKGRVRRKLRK